MTDSELVSVVFVAGVWFVLGVVVCVLSGRGIDDGQTRRSDVAATRPIAPAPNAPAPTRAAVHPAAGPAVRPRRFVERATHEWALAADRVALADLLATPSGDVRPAPAE